MTPRPAVEGFSRRPTAWTSPDPSWTDAEHLCRKGRCARALRTLVEERSGLTTRHSAAAVEAMWRTAARLAPLRQAPGMPRRRHPLPSSLRWEVFSAAEARAAGVPGSRLVAGDLIRIDHGLYARSGRPADMAGTSGPTAASAHGAVASGEVTSGEVTSADVSSLDQRSTTEALHDDPTTDREGPRTTVPAPPVDGADTVREVDVIRALQRTDPDAVACGLSAARLWRLPLPLEHADWTMGEPDAQITMSRSGIHRPRKGLVTWRSCDFSPSDRTRERGIVTTSRLRTFLDLADVLDHDDLVAMGDHLVRTPRPRYEGRTRPYVEISQLAEAVSRFRGRGARRLRSAMADVRVGADSPPETELRLALLRAGLPEPLLNTTIRQDGRWLGDPDMAWREWKVCVEYDGRGHRTQRQQAKDVRRGERRRLAGWTELIITVVDMEDDATQAIDRVRAELLRRGMPS